MMRETTFLWGCCPAAHIMIMKNIDLEGVIGFDALYLSMCKCRKGVIWKDSVAHYCLNALEETLKLERELKDGTYQGRKPYEFTLMYPKRRDVLSICFRDRVYQRSLNDVVVYPTMTKSFIWDNWACQKGKGTDACRTRFKKMLYTFFTHFGLNGWVAQFDIHGYYPNMNHDVAESVFRMKLPDNVYQRVLTILRDQYKGDAGYNPGSQLIQIAGISVLNGMDHYIKEQLHCKYYIRYMDDFIIVHPDRQELERISLKVREYLNQLGFTMNEKKTRIYPFGKGIMFLGFRFKPTETGKILMLINPNNVKAQRKKLFRLVAKAKRGEISRQAVREAFDCWCAHAAKGNCYNLLVRMTNYYKELWKG